MLSLAKRIRENVTPARRTSAFLTRGVLTPDEFVAAGEQLVFKCPTWTWESGDPSRSKDCLPDKKKQFLVTRNVPCHRRAKALEGEYIGDTEVMTVEGGQEDDAWVEPNVVADPSRTAGGWGGRKNNGDEEEEEEELQLGGGTRLLGRVGGDAGSNQDGIAVGLGAIQLVESHFTSPLEEASGPTVVVSGESGVLGRGGAGLTEGFHSGDVGIVSGSGGEGQEDYTDLDSYVEDNLMQGDEATVQPGSSYLTAQEPEDSILPTRTYDLSITYDQYHQTPRMWLFGYDESGQPLSAEEVFEDVMQDYAKQTVTMELHPHLSSHHASVHPCKHASTMKIMLENLTKGGKEARVDQYLFIFLKFIQSVVPTIDYDYTMSVDAGGGNSADDPDSIDAFVDVAETS